MRTALQKHPCKSQINFIQPIINDIDDIKLGGDQSKHVQ